MRPISASISRQALRANLDLVKQHAGGARVWAVVKANAYGHGLLRTVAALEGADGFALLELDTAVQLRDSGISRPLLLIEGFFGADELETYSARGLTAVVHDRAQLHMLEKARLRHPVDIYLKVNTGMNRLGFAAAEAAGVLERLRGCAGVAAITLMTHFADADGAGGVAEPMRRLEQTGIAGLPLSLANSAALLRYPQTRADWVRPGIMLYGCSPFADQSARELGLKPAMTLSSEIIGVQHLQAGECVGYGFSYEAQAETTLGVVACGYGDGY